MKATVERIFPTEQFANIKIHLEDDVKTEESTEQVILRLVANLKLKTVEDAIYAKPTPPTAQTAKPTPQTESNIEDKFPAQMAERLNFTVSGNKTIVKPKEFLGSDLFAQISQVIRGLGGQYVSAGKDSHWEVP